MTGPLQVPYADLLGKPFRYGGRGPEAFDCYGLAIELRRRAGLPMPEDYLSCSDLQKIGSSIEDGISRFAFEIPEPRPCCLVTFHLHPAYTTHLGFVLADCLRFVHVMERTPVAVERLDSLEWHAKISGFFEINPFEANFREARHER